MITGGFKTKNQEEEYSKALYGLVFLMQFTISKLIPVSGCPDVLLSE